MASGLLWGGGGDQARAAPRRDDWGGGEDNLKSIFRLGLKGAESTFEVDSFHAIP